MNHPCHPYGLRVKSRTGCRFQVATHKIFPITSARGRCMLSRFIRRLATQGASCSVCHLRCSSASSVRPLPAPRSDGINTPASTKLHVSNGCVSLRVLFLFRHSTATEQRVLICLKKEQDFLPSQSSQPSRLLVSYKHTVTIHNISTVLTMITARERQLKLHKQLFNRDLRGICSFNNRYVCSLRMF